jgi:hypothetical protein
MKSSLIRTVLRNTSFLLSGLLVVGAGVNGFAAAPVVARVESRAETRIAGPIDESARVVLRGNVHPQATAKNDLGVAPAGTPASRLLLLLKHSPTQAQAAREYIDSLEDKKSPNYHKWLTPEEFGAKFGPSDGDIQAVSGWLKSHGFRVERVAKARNVIEFSGNAGQVMEAFHASIHSYLVNGERHFANANDPEIPAALAGVVGGVTQLNDFHPKRTSMPARNGHWDANAKRIVPDITFTSSDGNDYLFVVPADAATIYNTPNANLNPAYKGKTIDGTGVTVGIVGDSNFAMQDVANYRAFFLHDTSTAHLPTVVVDGSDPGVNGDAVEALLDNEVVTGLAPKTEINFYTAADTNLQSGLFLAIFRALNDNDVDILNVSFGGCEAAQGQAGNEQIYSAWEQATAQGISVTVSTGDSGSADCDNPDTEQEAAYGLAINGLGSTPYTVAVGGSDFGVLASNYPQSFYAYMNSSNGGVAPYYGTAAGYIPETTWNNSTQNNTTLDLNDSFGGDNQNIAAGGGGRSSCGYMDSYGSCLGGYAKPGFQANLTPADGVRDIPDVSLFASSGVRFAAWALCADSEALPQNTNATDCQLTDGKPTSATSLSGIGGTSAAAPAFAGMLALISQSTGGRLGNPNPVLYALAQNKPEAFHDITVGNNSVNCYVGTQDCGNAGFETGYDTETGYDLASGLGSVNATELLKAWTSVTFASSTTTLALGEGGSTPSAGAIVATHGTPINFNIDVTPGASVTGSVSLIADTDAAAVPDGTPAGYYPVTSGGVVTGSTKSLPGGSYNLYAYYGGDSEYAASKSNPVPVTISPEDSSTELAIKFYDASTQLPLSSTTAAPYGAYFFATATPRSNTGADGTATGSVTFTNAGKTLGSAVALSSQGWAQYSTLNENPLPAGSYQLAADYSGDASYKPSVSKPVAFSITKAQISASLASDSAGVNYGGSVTLQLSIGTDSIGNFPTGSVSFMSGSTVLGSAQIVGGYNQQDGTVIGTATATITGTQFPKNGVNAVTAVYAGDVNYVAATSNAVGITVSGIPSPKIGVSGPATLTLANPGASATATITVTPFGGFTGAVNLTCTVTGPAGAVAAPTCGTASATITGTTAATATLNISSQATTTAGAYTLTVTGADAATGAVTSSTTIALTVVAAPVPAFTMAATAATIAGPGLSATSAVTVTASGGFTGAVTLSCAGAGFSCDPATATVAASGAAATANLTIHAASTVTPGSYTLTVSGVDATGKVTATTTAQVTVNTALVPSFTVAGTAVTVASPGATANSTISVTPSGGFTGAVTLNCSVTAAPAGAVSAPTCASATATVTGAAAVTVPLSVVTTSTTTAGSYTIAVTAASGTTTATANLAVTVQASTTPAGFTVTGTQVTIASLGASGSSTITVTPAGGFTGQVNLQCAIASAPAGTNDDPTCSFGTTNSILVTGATPVTGTMTVTTSTAVTAMLQRPGGRPGLLTAAGGMMLSGLLFGFMPARRRNRFLTLALLLAVSAGMAIGCGGGGSHKTSVNGTGTFTYKVTGTDAATGAIVSSATVTVTVQ